MTARVLATDALPVPVTAVDRAIADASAKATLYTRVSRTAAAEGDPRVAMGAAWTADVLVVQTLLWERASADEEQARHRFRAVATAVGTAVCGAAGTAEVARVRDAREVVVTARRRMLSLFDGAAADLVADRLQDLEHLAQLPPAAGLAMPGPTDSLHWRAREIGAVALAELLRVEASDGRVIADALLAATYRRDAAHQACLAALAEAETYLVEASVAIGDHALLLADVRRAAILLFLSETGDRPVDVAAARAGVWAAVRAALPPIEVLDRLAPRLGRTGPAGGTASPESIQ